MWEQLGKLGVAGFVVVANVITVCGLAAWVVINGADKEIQVALVTVLAQGAALAFAAGGKFLGGNGGS